MTVYVDDMRAPFGLHAMADRIGVARKWFQGPPKHHFPHYDIALSKRALAVQFGAQEVTGREMVRLLREALGGKS